MNDPYETGIPKYSTASDIYEALCELTQTEEMSILSEMFADVSYDNQGYYYTDKGCLLKERFEELSDNGDKMWLMDLAVWQIDQTETHDLVWEALHNPDLARRIGFKKLFIEQMLGGDKHGYDDIAEEFIGELGEFSRFDNWAMIKAFNRVMQARGKVTRGNALPTFSYYFAEKLRGLQLQNETRLIAECRALLTAYDDFMLGLRMNQHLYTRLEEQYKEKVLQLKANYEAIVRQLILTAADQGIVFEVEAAKMLPDKIYKETTDET